MTRKWLAAGFVVFGPAVVLGQGFGKIKKPVMLDRKLPAAVKLQGNTFIVKATAEAAVNSCNALAADKLQSTVEADLIHNNNQLILNPAAPDTSISIRVLSCYAVARPQYAMQFGKNPNRPQQPSGYKVTADLSVTYEARGRDGGFVDAEPLDVKYNHEFDNAAAAISGLLGRGEEEPHTPEEVVQVLTNRMAQRIAARLVNTDERVEVLLGKGGPLDDANRYAEAGQWTRFVEALETMPPLTNAADDSYRLYNIGVGDEALGYKAETPTSATKYFEKAVIQYRKAGEANPHEKYFIQPVNRIEIALEHYKELALPARPSAAPSSIRGTPEQPQPPTVAPAPGPRPAAGPFQTANAWRVTEIINGALVNWVLYTNVDSSFRATMGDATVASGSWGYDAAKHALELTGTNLVLRASFRCILNLNDAQPNAMNGVCLDHLGTRYRTNATRQ
jgi:hypothetical protein